MAPGTNQCRTLGYQPEDEAATPPQNFTATRDNKFSYGLNHLSLLLLITRVLTEIGKQSLLQRFGTW